MDFKKAATVASIAILGFFSKAPAQTLQSTPQPSGNSGSVAANTTGAHEEKKLVVAAIYGENYDKLSGFEQLTAIQKADANGDRHPYGVGAYTRMVKAAVDKATTSCRQR